MFVSTKALASLAACLFLTGGAQAAPAAEYPAAVSDGLSSSSSSSSSFTPAAAAAKRVIDWDYRNTQAVEQGDGQVKKTAQSLSGSPEIKKVFNWESWRPSEMPSSLAFQPMIRLPSELGKVGDAKAAIKGQKAPVVHFYNEPERAGVSAAEAAASWKSALLPLRRENKAVKLVGPAPASDDAGSKWLAEFMGHLAAGEKPDYTGVHFYSAQGDAADKAVAAAKKYIKAAHDKYKLPVAVSEVACTSRDAATVHTFTKQVAAWLDAQGWVAQYGFFGASKQPVDGFVSPAAQLMDAAGKWTALGKWLAGL